MGKTNSDTRLFQNKNTGGAALPSLYLLYFLILLLSTSYVHSSTLRFSKISLKEGLSQLSVLAIAQDRKGYLWFGTRNGLNRYDGEQLMVYKHENGNPHSLSDSQINCLLPDDSNERLWVGTNNGLNYIDLKTGQIVAYRTENTPGLAGNNITVLRLGTKGELWVGTRTGLSVQQGNRHSFRQQIIENLPPHEAITDLHIGTQGEVYIGTHRHGLLICTSHLKLVKQLNKKSSPSLSDDAVSCIFEDSSHHIWIGTETRGVNRWSPKTQALTSYDQHNSALSNDYIRCIAEQDQKLIIGTFDGLSLLDLKENKFEPHNMFDAPQQTLSHFSVRSLYVDRENTLWVGTYSGGINYYHPRNNRFLFYHPKAENQREVHSIFGTMVYDNKHLWIATEGEGLMRFDPATKRSTYFPIERKPEGAFNRNIIKSLLLDGEYIWCGTSTGGIYKFHIPTRHFNPVYAFDREKNISIYAIHKDSKGNIWMGTTAGKGLLILSPTGVLTDHFPYGKEGEKEINFSSVRSFLPLNEYTFLIGTRSFGLFEYDTKRGTVLHYHTEARQPEQRIESNYITSMLQKKNGEVWVGTFGGGLYRYEQGKGITHHIGSLEGLPGEEVCALVEQGNRLWISAGRQIAELDTENGRIHSYDCFADSEVLEFTPQGGISLPNGEIYFSGNNGFLSFTPGLLQKNATVPPIVLTQLTVNNRVIQPRDETGVLTHMPDDTKTLTLAYNQNNFSIAYSALNYILHSQNKYAYKLLGHEEDWNYVGNRKEAFYTNIAPGSYTFHVIAGNNDGVWNEQGKRLRIIIRPPWWKTPWAYLLYLLSVVGILYTVFYHIRSKQKLKLSLHLKQVEQQQLEEFHRTKLQLFTNFSHELRTPLTLIISPLEELTKRIGLPQALKEQLQLMQRNAHRLLLQVNQLMDLQKEQSGNLTARLANHDLNAFLLEIFYTFRQITESKQIRFEYEAPLEKIVLAFDQGLLEKAVFNLLSNSIKFTPPGESIVMRLQPATEERGSVVIQVADTGKGIPEKERINIFTPFYQVVEEESQQSLWEGTGIGLSLTQAIINLHQGTIEVEANEPKGSIFTIHLPRQILQEEETPASVEDPEAEYSEAGVPPPVLPGKSILIVEDNKEIREYLKGHLSAHYQIWEARNGTEAFEIVLREYPDLVITDIMMPDTDGLQLCATIKANLQTGHIPVILLTARTLLMHIKEGFLAGADDYVVKPFQIDLLLVRIYNLLLQREKLKATYSRHFSLQSMGIETEVSSADERFMQRLFESIEQHLSDPELKVDTICEEMGFSRSNFYRKLKALTELSLNELIRHKRLETAALLLKESDMNITEVATATGFSTLAYFTKCFKKSYSVAPSEYQKSHTNLD